jgi:hypothetical protein
MFDEQTYSKDDCQEIPQKAGKKGLSLKLKAESAKLKAKSNSGTATQTPKHSNT